VTEVKHTPLPWVSKGRYIGGPMHMSYVGEVRDENGNWSDTAKSRDDAAFIVRACNSHYDLLEAAKWAEAAISPFSKDPAGKSGIAKLRAAIAKAEGR